MIEIKRIDNYSDNRFDKRVLAQHGAYIIDDKYPCQFLIISNHEAIIDYHDHTKIDEIITKFRFYSRHITKFYDLNKNLLREYKDIILEKVNIYDLQPSQFFVDETKINAISTWAKKDEDFLIPIMKIDNSLIIVDGHTRLFLAHLLGFKEIFIYEDKVDDDIIYFVNEARRRNIYSIKDLKQLSHEDYIEQWDGFCDDFFNNVK